MKKVKIGKLFVRAITEAYMGMIGKAIHECFISLVLKHTISKEMDHSMNVVLFSIRCFL